ncbi:AAA domain-containing protein [Marinoscillum sp. MHG1-6]|uniref:AAA domain-containing protein n=1 Tax=Marinoscillum sp. MHG1-6 TaxID=2959627 RepID=UPI0021578859|nr:AAA domain-containing protein [Marinoscillum sp. MHG1-6]
MKFEGHFQRLLNLIKKERQEDRKQYEEKIRNRSLQDRKKEGVTWYPVTLQKSYLGTGEKWVLQVERTTDLNQRHFFQPGSSVSLFLNDEKRKLSASGIITRMNEHRMTFMLNAEDEPDWIDEGKVGINLLFDEGTYDEMEKTMVSLSKTSGGRIAELMPVLLGEQQPHFDRLNHENVPGLNASQQNALDMIRSANDIALVHGPPGTGKTTTLIEAIREKVLTEKQVLVCAASNAAVDLLAEKLSEQDVRVLRLGHPARVTEAVVRTTLDARLSEHNDARMLRDLRRKSEEMRSLGRKYKRNFGHDERKQRKLLLDEARSLKDEALMLEGHMIFDELNKAQVIACTLVGANNSYLGNRQFKTVFIDEASQALEPACWIPIMKAEKVVMAGDHWQLSPTVKSLEAGKQGLTETIFERTIKRSQGHEVMLKTQYRMHPNIMAFSNAYFYKGELESAEIIGNRRQLFNDSVSFIDTAGCGFDEKINQETLSTYNEEEAAFVLNRLDTLIQENREMFASLSIGVIAPYKAQTEVLKNQIIRFDWYADLANNITINSVDAFQGQERDVMIISLVRSNSVGVIGFLADERRMNVAMTRARHLLMMVGDSSTLSSNDFFDLLIQDMQSRSWYHSAFEYLY